ncbi:chromate efflux transporter [Bauldia litoralis]|uniref:Chromate transporter n=1 Tax=Bauldia litoralis TaxID=665467 RepID=A0A1G6D8X8_9HYPH|nr:chromate efflux transporter [Bauldia litoralis]SDB41602.1 chromate transporter [Bauldia litoralis]
MSETGQPDADATSHPSFAEATRVWATIGLLSFGGPAGQIALMHRILVDERRWISEPRFLHALNFCMLLPGPEAQQLATYVGWLLHGTRGGVVAGTLFVLPGLAVILGLSTLYAVYQDTGWLEGIFFGLKAAVLAIVIDAVIRIGRRALKSRFAVILAAIAFVAIFVFGVPFPVIVILAGLAGYLRARMAPGEGTAVGEGESKALEPDRLHSSETTRSGAVRVIATWGALWAAPIVGFALLGGWESIYPRLALFFSWLAVVTFGGAYAVLAYVADAAVSSFGWLSAGEMLDGLAMAETTPGPLIIVLSYVGYIAAFRAETDLDPLIAGLIGGALTAWVTFVPCFLWIFLGAPYVEKLRGNLRLSGALSAITAAVVGVILNLALWLGLHVLFREVGVLEFGLARPPWPVWGSVDPWAVGLMVVAIVALFRFRLGVVPTLAICAGLGLLVRFLA